MSHNEHAWGPGRGWNLRESERRWARDKKSSLDRQSVFFLSCLLSGRSRRRFAIDRGGVNLGETRSSRPRARGRGRVLLADIYIRTLASEVCLSIYVESSPRHRPRLRRSPNKKKRRVSRRSTWRGLRHAANAASRGAAEQSEEDGTDGAHARRSARDSGHFGCTCVARFEVARVVQHSRPTSRRDRKGTHNSIHPHANGCSDMPRSKMTWFHAFSIFLVPGSLTPESLS
jgi:hypothetical protein